MATTDDDDDDDDVDDDDVFAHLSHSVRGATAAR